MLRFPVYDVSIDISAVDKVALGPFGTANEESFWVALVEGKKLHHLGYVKAGASVLRNSLALGEILFRDSPEGIALFQFIEDKLREFLTSGRLKRIYFDTTNMDTLSGTIGEGRFAFVELKLIYESDALFRITSFYRGGRYIRTTREKMRGIVRQLLQGKC